MLRLPSRAMRRWLGVLAVTLVVVGCAGKKRVLPPDKLWSEANHAFDDEAYELAADRYKSLLDQYPFDTKAAEARLSGLLSDYPETDATAQALHAFAKAYEDRKEPEGATLALATLARYHPDGPLGADARQRLGPGSPYLDGVDPLPLLVGRIEEMRLQADRQQVPRTVSAYPEIGGSGGSPY